MSGSSGMQISPGRDRDSRLVVGLSVGLIAYSSVVHLVPGFNLLYVPLGIISSAALLVLARWATLTTADLGTRREHLRPGIRLGALIAGLAVFTIGAAVVIPASRPLFTDARVADVGLGLVAYRALIRIPLGTALFEEIAFRGVLFGAWQRWKGTRGAVVGSSVVFGLWHVRPALDLVNANDLAASYAAQLGLVAGSVLLTTIAGIAFCLLRIRTSSLAAPLLAHAAINSIALIAAALATSN